MITRKAIALCPTPECLCLAALCRGAWDVLHPTGPGMIVDLLESWEMDEDVAEAIILLPRVDDVHAVQSLMKKLDGHGVKIRWFAPTTSPSVEQALCGCVNAELYQENSIRRAFETFFPPEKVPNPLLVSLDDADSGLKSYLQYMLSLFFMRLDDPAPLDEATEFLSTHSADRFRLENLHEDEQAAVSFFQECDFPFLEGRSPVVRTLKARLLKVAQTDMSVLITGAAGSGREAAAFYLHELSHRKKGPFTAFNCTGIKESYMRSELFGHKKGAFTGADSNKSGLVKAADGGTLFLDDVVDISPTVQADLLRLLQTGRFRRVGGTQDQRSGVRVVAAAGPDIDQKVTDGLFREDLYFRLAEVELKTPSLNDASEDILCVVRHIIDRSVDRQGVGFDACQANAYFEAGLKTLKKYSWPGNVRELSGLIKRRLLLGDDVLDELNRKIESETNAKANAKADHPLFINGSIDPDSIRPVDDVVAEYIKEVFRSRGGLTHKQVAERLGKSLNTVKKFLRK